MIKGPETNLKTELAADPYADLTTSERVDEYLRTGNYDCLNREAAMRMHLSPEELQNVEGITDDDFDKALYREAPRHPREVADKDIILQHLGLLEDEYLLPFGLGQLDLPTDEELDQIADMSEEERWSEYGLTGLGIYLTPSMARKIKAPYPVMKSVLGASDQDLADSRIWQKEGVAEDESIQNEFLAKYGLDPTNLKELKDDDIFKFLDRLFTAASQPIHKEDDREIVDIAHTLLFEYLVSYEKSVNTLFSLVDYGSTRGIREIQIINEMFKRVYDRYMVLANNGGDSESTRVTGNRLGTILNEFSVVFENRLSASETPEDINYLTDRYLVGFCLEGKFSEPGTLDEYELWQIDQHIDVARLADFNRDGLIPFEITEGQLALFGWRNTTLHVADAAISAELGPTIQYWLEQVMFEVLGQPFAKRISADVPDEIDFYTGQLLDASLPLGREFSEFETNDADLLRDYLFMMQASMRTTIEKDFDIELKKLSIAEQFYFLSFLQKTTVAESEQMQNFTSTYDIAGMRTFLALEHGGDISGDDIVNFTETVSLKDAEHVFAVYSELLDGRAELGEVIRQQLDCTERDCEALIAAGEARMTAQTHEYLIAIIKNPDQFEGMTALLQRSAADARVAAAVQVSLAEGEISTVEDLSGYRNEILPGGSIPDSLINQLMQIYEANYQKYGYRRESIAKLKIGLEKSLKNPNSRLYVRRIGDDNILAFGVVTPNPETGTAYVSGLNANPNIQKTQSGISLFQEIVTDYREQGWTLTAEATLQNFRGYGEINDWVALETVADDYGEENFMFNIALYPDIDFISKELDRPELIDRVAEVDEAIGDDGVLVMKKYSDSDRPEQPAGYVITRAFMQPNHDGQAEYIYVLEQPQSSESTATEPQTQNVA